MSDAYTEYAELLSRYLEGSISTECFQHTYLDQFKNEKRHLDERLFELLDSLFGDIDAFSTNKELLEENPEHYLNEDVLRKNTAQALRQLEQLQNLKRH